MEFGQEAYDSEAAAVSMDVCRTISAEQRTFHLSFKHYREAILLTRHNVEAACVWSREAEENNWSVSELQEQIRLDQADKSSTLTIQSLNHASLYQHINSLYSFVKSCDVDEDASILDKLEEGARSLIKVISEKRSARTRGLVGVETNLGLLNCKHLRINGFRWRPWVGAKESFCKSSLYRVLGRPDFVSVAFSKYLVHALTSCIRSDGISVLHI